MARVLLVLLVAITLTNTGCRTCRKRVFGDDRPLLGAPARVGSDPLLIPPPAGGLPSSAEVDPSPRGSSGSPDLPPPPVIPESKSQKPPLESKKELVLPDPLPGGKLDAPALLEPSTSSKVAPKPAVNGISGFAIVRDGVATGRKPTLEGVEQLLKAGYKTLVYLHAADADVASVKALAETRGLAFQAIEVDAKDIRPAIRKFVEVVGDGSVRPVYVFDDDGARAGSLWYAYFRRIDGLSDDAAQVRAAPLGLRDAPADLKTKLLTAVQDDLAKR